MSDALGPPYSYTTFKAGIAALADAWARTDREGTTEWQEVRVLEAYDTAFLRITKISQSTAQLDTERHEDHHDLDPNITEDDSAENPLVETDDEVIFHRTLQASRPASKTTYDIIYSPTYQVPVLYFTPVPPLQSGHPIGALSMTDHPITQSPVYFVHPCRTAEALESMWKGKTRGSAIEDLMMWLGLVGPEVGLHVPLSLATILGKG